MSESATRDVAIIGMAALFPQAPDASTLWRNVLARVDAISDPLDWPAEFACDPTSTENDRVYTRRGGYLGDLVTFDPTAYGVMPRAVDGGEPEHFVALRLAHEALADAGYAEREFPRERTAVILGRGTYVNRGMIAALQHGIVVDQTIRLLAALHPEHTPAELEQLRTLLKAQLPPFNSETAQSLAHSAMCGRIANRLDLMGPAYTVDAACASSLIAVEQAGKELLDGTCDLALAGGIQISTSFPIAVLFCQLGALSRTGQLRSFHPDADGTLLGEGAGILVLKRRADAERDGDRIYALVKGVGIASDGKAMGVLTPRVEGEELALRRAYAAAGVSPETIGLVEAHGTGTVAGDATELAALARVFAPRTASARCALGSIKSMIGHSIPAAGVAGLIKAALALHYKILPPTLHADTENPSLADGAFYLNAAPRPWVHGAGAPRRAGVSAFGFGGINAHVVLEEHEPPPAAHALRPTAATPGPRDSELFVLWGASRDELRARLGGVQRFLAHPGDASAADVAAALARGFDRSAPWRLAVVAGSIDELARKLAHAAERLADASCVRIKDRSGIFFFAEPLGRAGTLAFLFPGEGAQYPDMLAELALHFPPVRACFDRMDRAARLRGDEVMPSAAVFPAPGAEEAGRRLWEMDGAVQAVFAADQALGALLGELDVVPEAIVGHSSGEYAALLAAGAVRLDVEADLIAKMHAMSRLGAQAVARGLVAEAPLLAVSPSSPQQIESLLAHVAGLHVAMDNCPRQVVLAGAEAAIAAAHAELRAAGALCQRLPFARGYHTPLFAPFRDEMRPFFDAIDFVAPAIPLYSCVTAAQMPADPAEIRRLALDQWARQVRFRETVEAMYAAGTRIFVEVGPRGNLSAFVDDVLQKRPHLAVPTNVEKRSSLLQLHHAVGLLVTHGVPVRMSALHDGRETRPLDLQLLMNGDAAAPPKRRTIRLPMTLPVLRAGSEERASIAGARPAAAPDRGPAPRDVGRTLHDVEGGHALANPGADVAHAGTGVMTEYLRTMEEFLGTQEQVMRAFLDRGRPAGGAGIDHPPVTHRPVPSAHTPPAAASPAPATASLRPTLDRDGLRTLLIGLISEKTGYPPDMIDPTVSLEADLGIDSIKRVEILGALDAESGLLLDEDLEALTALRTLDEIVDCLATRLERGHAPREAGGDGAPEPARAILGSTLPPAREVRGGFAGTILRRDGDALIVRYTLSLERERFLREHTLGGRVSNDPALRALPVCPLAMTLELMAEAAALAMPNARPIALTTVRAQRWLALTADAIDLEATVRPVGAAEMQVTVRRCGPDGRAEGDPPLVEGTVCFAATFPPPPAPRAFALAHATESRWAPHELYDAAQPHGMFHGPVFQAVAAIERVGADGVEGTLRALASDALFTAQAAPQLALDPVLVDAAGQLLGFWNAQQLDVANLIFPVGLERLEIFGAPLAPPEQARCRVQVRRLDAAGLTADIDIVGSDGAVHLRVTGWEVRRCPLPPHFYAFRLNPRGRTLTRPLRELSDERGAAVCFEMPAGFFESDGAIWRDSMAFLVLGPEERATWRALGGSDKRRREWLMGRIALKDAVREYVRARHGLVLYPADVEIEIDEHGRPHARGAWVAAVGTPPHVSVAHSDHLAVAIAGSAEGRDGLGIDVERLGRTGDGFERGAFGAAERALLDGVPAGDRGEWSLRLWCAKEAVVKAIGRGFVDGPHDAPVRGADLASGAVEVGLAGALAGAVPGVNGRGLRARTLRLGEVVLAVAEVPDDGTRAPA